MISRTHAAALTIEWMKRQEYLPHHAFLRFEFYDAQREGRRITVAVCIYFIKTREVKTFRLVVINAKNTGMVEILHDRRESVWTLISNTEHKVVRRGSVHHDDSTAYQAFYAAITERCDAPEWFKNIELYTEALHAQDYDGFVHIVTSSEKDARVPFIIFPTAAARAQHNREKSTAYTNKTLTLVVPHDIDDTIIRHRFYHILAEMRRRKIYPQRDITRTDGKLLLEDIGISEKKCADHSKKQA